MIDLPDLAILADPKERDRLLEQARKASDLLKTLSHETRLLILYILSKGEKSVSELEEILTMPQAAVSQKLARLRMKSLVNPRREDRIIYYSLVDDEVRGIVENLYSIVLHTGPSAPGLRPRPRISLNQIFPNVIVTSRNRKPCRRAGPGGNDHGRMGSADPAAAPRIGSGRPYRLYGPHQSILHSLSP
ncbi:metalloregulator ArsR/SmtB family transcription factor [Breoghania sp.]|uniref:ArsR/SmtB family transcription factor n=1 Tax=Breoghania sp. TaxID=2065378 RepID=UPI0032049C53